ncbi:MAG: alpha/beta hydrolase [Deltaproteobacteria bacterium]|nr:alpha/beta hydrolase [Deltaproteobacteria bacterium]
MIDIEKIDYSAFDIPQITQTLFYPRLETGSHEPAGPYESVLIPVEGGIHIGGCFHLASEISPNILFFHGNGEIVSDYDDMALLYLERGINFLPVDYRGYGRSTGRPSVTSMMRDCHVIFKFTKKWLRERRYGGAFIVMGRSLGSASAMELVAGYSDEIDGLIIESGFAYVEPLLNLLGMSLDILGLTEKEGFGNIEKIRRYRKPTLIIHGEYDEIIPFSEGRSLFEASPARHKRFLPVQFAGHNDLFFRGMNAYLDAVGWLAGVSTESQEAS